MATGTSIPIGVAPTMRLVAV